MFKNRKKSVEVMGGNHRSPISFSIYSVQSCICFFLILFPFQVFADTLVPLPEKNPESLLPNYRHVATLEAEVDFTRGLGSSRSDTVQVLSNYVDNGAGWALAGSSIDGGPGIALPEDSVFRITFFVQAGSEPVSAPSSPVYTLQVRDADQNVLAERMLNASDFPERDHYYPRSLLVSTVGLMNPRLDFHVFWHGQVNAMIDRVDIEQYIPRGDGDLLGKMLTLDQQVQDLFTENGYVVARKGDHPAERGDSATFTALYVMSQAKRLVARPGDAQALANLERGFQALERLFQVTRTPGILARYADDAGNWSYKDCLQRPHAGIPTGACSVDEAICAADSSEDPKCPDGTNVYSKISNAPFSEDVFTAYAVAVAHGYEFIQDQELKIAVKTRMSEVAQNLLDHNLAIVGPDDYTVWLRPYFSQEELKHQLRIIYENNKNQHPDSSFMEQLLPILNQVEKYEGKAQKITDLVNMAPLLAFTLPVPVVGPVLQLGVVILSVTNCLPSLPNVPDVVPPYTVEITQAFDRGDMDAVVEMIPAYLEGVRKRLVALHRYSSQMAAALQQAVECAGRLPNSDPGLRYRNVINLVRGELLPEVGKLFDKLPAPITRLEDLPVKAGRLAEALMILEAARTVDSKFDAGYQSVLNQLPTLEAWLDIDEYATRLVKGDAGADLARSSTSWRTTVALYSLAEKESEGDVRARFKALTERVLNPTIDEHNPLYDAIFASLFKDSTRLDRGVMAAQFDAIPLRRTGLSESQVNAIREAVASVSGGSVEAGGLVMREPIPLSVLEHGQFFAMQRNPRNLESALEATETPAIDAVLAYWIAAAAGVEFKLANEPAVPHYAGPIPLASSGVHSLTVGKGQSALCKTEGQDIFSAGAPPVGPVSVPMSTGADIGWIHARILAKRGGQVSFSLDGKENYVTTWAEVCRRGNQQTDGELNWLVDIVAPTRTADMLSTRCGREIFSSSGERSITRGRSLKHKTKGIEVWVPLPSGFSPLTPLTLNVGQKGYEDDFTRVKIIAWQRVDWLTMERKPDGVLVRGQISSSSGGGGELKLMVDILGRRPWSLEVEAPNALTFESAINSLPSPQGLDISAVSSTCPVAPRRWKASLESGAEWGLHLRSTSGLPGEKLVVEPAAVYLPEQGANFAGKIKVEVDGAVPKFIDVNYSNGSEPLQSFLLEAENGLGGSIMQRSAASGRLTRYLADNSQKFSTTFNVPVAGEYNLKAVYSNDNWPPERTELVHVVLDGENITSFRAQSGCCNGFGWNQFFNEIIGRTNLSSGEHILEVAFEGGDGYGIEFDRFEFTP